MAGELNIDLNVQGVQAAVAAFQNVASGAGGLDAAAARIGQTGGTLAASVTSPSATLAQASQIQMLANTGTEQRGGIAKFQESLRNASGAFEPFSLVLNRAVFGFGGLITQVAAATLSIQAFVGAMQAFSARQNALMRIGGDAQTSGRLQALSAAVGISPTEIPGLAASIRSRLGGGRAAAEFGRVIPGREVLPNLDEARIAAEAIGKVLDKSISDESARGRARLFGVEDFLILRRASNNTEDSLNRFAESLEKASAVSEKSADTALQFNLAMEGASQLFQGLAVVLTKIGEFLLRQFNDVSKDLLTDMKEAEKKLFGEGAENPVNAQTKATLKNTDAMLALTREVTGGGKLARGAVPAGLRSGALDNAITQEALRLGAFSL